ncbi:MAG: hypothetical protein IKP73_15745 [Bacteroidales bacterium]|nr:hypothetical protein [Bacteroidales bacterium]
MIKFFVYTDGAVAAVCDCKKYADIHADYHRLTGCTAVTVRRKKTTPAELDELRRQGLYIHLNS